MNKDKKFVKAVEYGKKFGNEIEENLFEYSNAFENIISDYKEYK